MVRIFNHTLAPLLLFSVALTALLIAYLAVGLAPSFTFQFVGSFCWSILLALWIVADARRRMGVPCYDFGFFCYLFLPVAIPWYCFWSRGLRGLLTLVIIALIWFVPYLVASIVWLTLYG